MREQILSEIRRIAKANEGRAPGRRAFERETGIREGEWYGIHWARWNDAVTEAGFAPNSRQGRFDPQFVLEKLAQAVRYYGRMPTAVELRMYKSIDAEFPGHNTFSNHFRTRAIMLARLGEWVRANSEYADLAAILPEETSPPQALKVRDATKLQEGFVYLIRSGAHFKIGRSEELERRVKEIRIALPEAAVLVHAIRTDDPGGIEAYWHRRFADRRANGEWFKLTPANVAAFKRRKYQ